VTRRYKIKRTFLVTKVGAVRALVGLVTAAALITGITPAATAGTGVRSSVNPDGDIPALLTKQATSATELQAQIDLQLKLFPGLGTASAQTAQASTEVETATSGDPTIQACSGSACDGRDPSAYCPSAVTVESIRLGQALLELRYSSACRSAWARISNANYDYHDQFTPFATIHRNSDGREYTCSVPRGASGCYTLMVNDAGVTSYARGMWDSGARTYEGRTASY